MTTKKTFASDNYAGVHPEIMEALMKANIDHAPSYGADQHTQRAIDKFKELFGDHAEVMFVYNGTGANVVGLSCLLNSFESVICSNVSHINVDECGAPEKWLGSKLITLPHQHGKITPSQVEEKLIRKGDQHFSQSRVISISQTTEYATVYTVEEIRALSALAKKHALYLHMDGSRIANAAASLGCALRDFTTDAGVDVLSFGGTKNGLMFGEAVVFLNKELASEAHFIRKQSMQLHSKMRFIGAQFDALFTDDLWLTNARHANAMATLLCNELKKVEGVTITHPVEANGVFAIFPKETITALQAHYFFYMWNETLSEVRLMCSFDTQPEEIYEFCSVLKTLL